MPKPEVAVKEKVQPKPSDAEVVVQLDENHEVVKPVEKAKEEPQYVRPEDLQEAIRKANSAFFAESRETQRLLKSLQERVGQPAQAVQPNVPQDEWDEKVQKDWKGTVQELAEKRYRELRDAERAEEVRQREYQKSTQLLEDNKRKVLERHPELNEGTSEKSSVYARILQKNPDYLYNPFGPVLAMRDMEDELRSNGVVDEPTKKIVEKEVSRQERVKATSVPAGSNASSNGKVVLTKDEREFCDHNNIKYETYAKNRSRYGAQGGIEV